MSLIPCPECKTSLSDKAKSCPQCGHPMRIWRSFEYKSQIELSGWPLVHIAFGRDKKTGKLLVAKGVIAIGQFAIGLITIAQFGVGFLFGFGQFVGGIIAIGQGAIGIYFGAGQLATGMTAIGQLALGNYALCQAGFAKYLWSMSIENPQAVEYFQNLLTSTKSFLGI